MDNKKQEELLNKIIENTKPTEEKLHEGYIKTIQGMEQTREKHKPKTYGDIIAGAYEKKNEENIKKELKEKGFYSQSQQDKFDNEFMDKISVKKQKASDEDYKAMLKKLRLEKNKK